jgi:hypothetical protein
MGRVPTVAVDAVYEHHGSLSEAGRYQPRSGRRRPGSGTRRIHTTGRDRRACPRARWRMTSVAWVATYTDTATYARRTALRCVTSAVRARAPVQDGTIDVYGEDAMLSREENLSDPAGAGTPMGELFGDSGCRSFWRRSWPSLTITPKHAPAERGPGRLSRFERQRRHLDAYCPHRRAPLFFDATKSAVALRVSRLEVRPYGRMRRHAVEPPERLGID